MLLTMMTYVSAQEWYLQGYNWARNIGIINSKTSNELSKTIDTVEFYDILFKYFEQNNVYIYYRFNKNDDYKNDNYTLVATDRKLTTLAEKDWITNNEYKTAKKLIDKANELVKRNEKYFTDEERDNINYYLEVMNYILYNKIYDYNYKITQSAKKPKNGDMFIKYKLIPFYGEVTREEFLILMYRYKINPETYILSDVVDKFVNENVLLGYDNNLMLTVKLNYSHMTTFLLRMQNIKYVQRGEE